MATGADTAVLGVAVGASSLLLEAFGVDADVLLVAACACFLGSPFAAPTGSPFRAIGTFLASVVLTCRTAALSGTLVSYYVPGLAPHEARVQAGAAIVTGVVLHIVISHAPAIVAGLLRRFRVVT